MNETILLLLTGLCSLIFSYLVVTVLSISGSPDDALGRDVQQLAMQAATLFVSTVMLPFTGLWSIGTDLVSMMTARAKWMIALVMLTALTFLMHYYHYEILSIMDDAWTCTFVPIMKNLITPLLQVTRVLFAIATPFANALLVIHGQIMKAWYVTLIKCSHVNLFRVFTELTQALITFTKALGKWFGVGAALTDDNNFYVNDFEMYQPINHTLTSISIVEDVLSCACKQFQPIFNIVFFATQEEHVTKALDAAFQAGIRVIQLLFRTLFKEFPDVYRISYKVETALIQAGLAADSILFNTLRNMIRLFDRDFTMTTYPQEGLFSVAARTLAMGVHTAATIGMNGPLHILAVFDPEKSAVDPENWSLLPTLSHGHSAVNAGAVFLQWIVYVVERLVTDTKDIGKVFSSPNTPMSLKCDWGRDVDKQKRVSISYTIGCTTYYTGVAYMNAWYIAWGASVELLTKSLFTQEQNMFRTLQRWEGPSLPRNKVYSCKARQQLSAYDYTNAGNFADKMVSNKAYYNKEGWLWTQDAGQCQCEDYYGTTRKEEERDYNPWCGQPNLNFDVFAHLDAAVMHVSYGVLGPGFGETIAYMNKANGINFGINAGSAGKFERKLKLPFPLPPMTRTAVESMRVLTRVALSFGDIITGHFFNYPVNCGHGLNKTQLQIRWEIDTGKSSMGLTDETLRWSKCKDRAYSAMTSAGDSQKRTPVCETTNESPDCMCSYVQPLTLQSPCQCISRYPDLDVTAASQEVGDLIEKRFTSTDVAVHWCNSMLIEWTFQNTAQFADALDYMVSLGPINPTCDVLDRLAEEGTLNTGARDLRSQSSFLIANTPTLYGAVKEFMSAEVKMNHMQDLFSESSSGCKIKPGEWVNATDERGNIVYEDDGVTAVQVQTSADWSCDASEDLVSLASLDQSALEEEPGCRIWGRNDFFCSAGLYVRNTKRLSMNVARQFVNDAMALLSGNYADVNIRTLPRLCDYERQQGALASMIASILPRTSTEMKQAFAKFINVGLQYTNVHLLRTVLIATNVASTMVMDFVTGMIAQDKIETTFITAIEAIVRSNLELVRSSVGATGDLLNAISPGAGDICDSVIDIVDMLRDQLIEGILDIAALGLKTLFQLVAVMTGDASVIDELFVNIFKLWAELQIILIRQMWTILDKIYEFFGPIGDFMRILTYGVCMAINGVMSVIDGTVRTVSLGFASLGWDPMKCVAPNTLGGEHFNHTNSKLGRHFLRASDNAELPRRVAETLDWNGTSLCDHFMPAAADYTYADLRPLEKAKWIECLELKMIGVELGKFFESKTFPTDIAYNWKRKYVMMYDTARALRTVADEYIDTKAVDWSSVRLRMYDVGLDADLYMKLFYKSQDIVMSILHTLEASSVLEHVAKHIDSDYANPANPSKTALAWRSYATAKNIMSTSTTEWQRRDMSKQMWRAADTAFNSHKHLHEWWNALGTDTPAAQSHTDRVFSNLKRKATHHFSERTRQSKRHKRGPLHWLRTPLRTELKSCAERGNPGWCTECAILDNAIKTVIVQGEAIGAFYGTRFPKILDNVGDYFDDLAEYNSDFFDAQFSKLARDSPSVPKTSVRWTQHVTKDWSELGGNFSAYYLDASYNRTLWPKRVEHFLNSSRQFLTVVDDAYVPFYGYSLYHMFDYIMFSTCDLDQSIFVTTTSQEARLQSMDYAFLACFIVAVVIITNTTWSIIPLVWLANTVVMGQVVAFIYLYMVYGYMLNCSPLVPYTLMEDFNAWYHTRLEPGCFYKQFPYMAIGATDDKCLMCAAPDADTAAKMEANRAFDILNRTTPGFNATYYDIQLGDQKGYLNCAEYGVAIEGSAVPLSELMSEYNIFWNAVFWIRWKLPSIGKLAVRYGLVSFESILGRLAMAAWQNEPVDPVWIDCFHATWLNNVVAGTVASVVTYVTVRISLIAIQMFIQMCLLVWYTYTAFGYLSLTLEKSME